MSNRAAIAAVTGTLRAWLNARLGLIGATTVTVARPDRIAKDAASVVNLFLFQITPNHGYRNADAPVRRRDGSLVNRPRTAVDLHYLVSATAKDDDVLPQVLMAEVLRTFLLQPFLHRDQIEAALDPGSAALDGLSASAILEIRQSKLAEQVESLKITPEAVPLDELAKIWSMFPDTPYQLSAVYAVTTVILEAEMDPEPALPVQQVGVDAAPFLAPVLDSARLVGGELVLSGQALAGGVVSFTESLTGPVLSRKGGFVAELPANLPLGTLNVSVSKSVSFDRPTGPDATYVIDSNSVAVMHRPVVTELSVAGDKVTVKLASPAHKDQVAVLILNRLSGVGAPTTRIEKTIAADSASIEFTTAAKGTFLARIRIDGADSLLDTDPAKKPLREVTL